MSQKQVDGKVGKSERMQLTSPCLPPLYLSGGIFCRRSSCSMCGGKSRYSLSYRNLEEMMQERGMDVDHSTINRWVLKYAPELDKRIRSHLSPTNDSWRTDETYIQIKGEWKYLYRAVNSAGNTRLLHALVRSGTARQRHAFSAKSSKLSTRKLRE